jgi:hypothetical protein
LRRGCALTPVNIADPSLDRRVEPRRPHAAPIRPMIVSEAMRSRGRRSPCRGSLPAAGRGRRGSG